MIKLFILIKIFLFILLNFNNYLLAGAPPLNKDPLPVAPYSLIMTKHIIIGVEWDVDSLKKIIPNILPDSTVITGGINIFNSRKKQTFSPLSGTYGWIDLPGENKKEKLIIFSIFGPNKLINKVMNNVYKLKSDIGSSKVTLINNKAIATSSISKKNVLILSAINMENCNKSSGQEILISKIMEKEKVYKKFSWDSDSECDITIENLEFKDKLNKLKVGKILWARTQENSKITLEVPEVTIKD